MISKNNWPASDTRSMTEFYGLVGQNQTQLKVPFPLKLSWNNAISVNSIRCHKKVAPSIERVLVKILKHYGLDAIEQLNLDQWGGCLNVRSIRGGTRYSTHSWGAANDWFPQDNGLFTPWNECAFSRPEYIEFLNAWIIEGWEPLGMSWGRDSMHIQATHNLIQPINFMCG